MVSGRVISFSTPLYYLYVRYSLLIIARSLKIMYLLHAYMFAGTLMHEPLIRLHYPKAKHARLGLMQAVAPLHEVLI